MKRKILLSIALALSLVFVSLTNSDSTAKAQQNGRRLIYDTGVVTLGQNQIMRVTVNIISGNNNAGVQFRRMSYGQETCSDGVCKALVNNEVVGPIIFFFQNEGVWMDIDRTAAESAVRSVITSNKPVRVNVQIVDSTTGNTVSLMSAGEIDTW